MVVYSDNEAIDAMAEAREAVSAYVATHGEGAPSPDLYGIQLGYRNNQLLSHIDILPANATLSAGTNHTFYIVANLWVEAVPYPGWPQVVRSFALSGSTNSDNSMRWTCIPSHPDDNYIPNDPNGLPETALPIECRG